LVGILAVGACGFGFYKECASYGRNHRKCKNIINIVNFTAGTISYINIKKARFVKREFVELDKNPQILDYQKDTGTHKVVVFIVGETARSANFSLHGYERKTNPLLEKQDIAYFKDATACGTSTAVSVPCMFSHLERKNFDVSDAEFTENLVDLAQKAGYHVIWRDNDDGCKGVCRRIKDLKDMQETKHPVYCNGKDCLDQILLDELMDIFPKIKQNTLIVLHAQGSHGPAYYKRYPDKFKKFLPTCDTSDIKDCSLDQIVNAYDNTILYTDYIISQAIDIAKKYPKLESSVIYVSDHGESLGENNIFLHGMPFGIAPAEQKSVPMLVWMNENMKKWDHIDYNCLKLSAEKNAYSHDNLFHSLLGLMAIKTSAYDKRYDLFDACRTKPLPYIGK
jgi:lipid A ethanolaminephosphotransferase